MLAPAARETAGGGGGTGEYSPEKKLKSRVSEMPFPTFWRKNLQISEGYEMPYRNTQIKFIWGRIKLYSEAGNIGVRANATTHAIPFKFG